MIFKNKDGSIYKLEVAFGCSAIPTLPESSELKPLEDKVDCLKKAILEIEEVINYLLEREEK